jgi:GH25 family lysozyme M1 (1,4-beta-N-acetylmuramidase)
VAAGFTLGVDVSDAQGTPDWQRAYKAGVRFAVVKLTEGDYYTNESADAQIAGAEAAGIKVGVYHYNGNTYRGIDYRKPGVIEAAYFSQAFKKYVGRPYFLDMENASGMVPQAAYGREFVDTCLATWGYKAGIYTFPSFAEAHSLGATLGDCALWYASWDDWGPGNFPPVPTGWGKITIWQFSGGMQVDGIGYVDGDYVRDLADFLALGANQSPVVPPINPDPVTGIWIHEYFVGGWDLAHHGRPIAPAALYSDGATRQLFERVCLGSNGRSMVVEEGLGQAYKLHAGDYPDWPDTHPLLG